MPNRKRRPIISCGSCCIRGRKKVGCETRLFIVFTIIRINRSISRGGNEARRVWVTWASISCGAWVGVEIRGVEFGGGRRFRLILHRPGAGATRGRCGTRGKKESPDRFDPGILLFWMFYNCGTFVAGWSCGWPRPMNFCAASSSCLESEPLWSPSIMGK